MSWYNDGLLQGFSNFWVIKVWKNYSRNLRLQNFAKILCQRKSCDVLNLAKVVNVVEHHSVKVSFLLSFSMRFSCSTSRVLSFILVCSSFYASCGHVLVPRIVYRDIDITDEKSPSTKFIQPPGPSIFLLGRYPDLGSVH